MVDSCLEKSIFYALQKSPTQWRSVFLLSAAIVSSGSLAFLIAGKGEIQEWAKEVDEDHSSTSEETECTDKGENV